MSISTEVKRKLWASSGGFCANPSCHKELFAFSNDGTIVNIEEMAHIIGQKPTGPRGGADMPISQRDEFDNLILLCPTCHTTVDKNPDLYTEDMLKQWKKNHEDSIKALFNIPKFRTRKEARDCIYPLLVENKMVFDTYGPYSKNAVENLVNAEQLWEKYAIQRILPNNRKIEYVIEQNKNLLTAEELKLFVEFKIHREGFEYNKISGDVNAAVTTFPSGFENILL